MLASHAHAVAIDDDLVLLSVQADAYYCLPDAAGAWRALRQGVASAEGSDLAATLAEAGLVDANAAHRAELPELPTRRLPTEAESRLRPADARNLIGAWLDVLRHYEGRSFAEILVFVRAGSRQANSPLDDTELRRLCAVFDCAVVWLPVTGKCLVRSFLRLRFLQRSGCDATWVFGVRVWPFLAHCWLQVGDTVLDDWPERLATYTPILEV